MYTNHSSKNVLVNATRSFKEDIGLSSGLLIPISMIYLVIWFESMSALILSGLELIAGLYLIRARH